MNQRQTNYFQDRLAKSCNYLGKGVHIAGYLGLSLFLSLVGDRAEVFAQPPILLSQVSPTLMQLNDILNQTVFGDDQQITRYAAAVNAIESKRLEIFKAAKNNPNWNRVASLAESQQIRVCDLSQQPDFLQDLCEELRSFSEDEIRRHGFTNKDFNQITRQQRQDAGLRSLIQSRQLRLRNEK